MLCGQKTGVYRTDAMHRTNSRLPRLRLLHLVLLLICLLNERSRDLVQLPERRNHPDGLRAALLGGLWGRREIVGKRSTPRWTIKTAVVG